MKEYVFTCSICLGVQADEPLDALLGPCGHRFHAGCWYETQETLTRNYRCAVRRAKVQRELGVADVQQPIKADYMRCPRCLFSFSLRSHTQVGNTCVCVCVCAMLLPVH